jgi:hypothetical protein
VEEVLPEIPCRVYVLCVCLVTNRLSIIAVTTEELQKHAKELLAKVKLSMLVAGNISKGVSGTFVFLG